MIEFANVNEWHIGQNEVVEAHIGNVKVWEKTSPTPPGPDYTEPFYIENVGNNNSTIYIQKSGSYVNVSIEESTDKTNWSAVSDPYNWNKVLAPGDKVYIRGIATSTDSGSSQQIYGWCYTLSQMCKFRATKNTQLKVGGNLMSLVYGSSFTGNEDTLTGKFCRLFGDQQYSSDQANAWKDAGSLLFPHYVDVSEAYQQMFEYCTGLQVAPSNIYLYRHSGTSVSGSRCEEMFKYCYNENFTTAPTINSDEYLSSDCKEMFFGCSYITNVQSEFTAHNIGSSAFENMFGGLWYLTSTPKLTFGYYTEYEQGQPIQWNMEPDCFKGMFSGCSSLSYVDADLRVNLALAFGYDSSYYCSGWLDNVASSGTLIGNSSSDTGFWKTGGDGIPENWTAEDENGNPITPIQPASGRKIGENSYYEIWDMGGTDAYSQEKCRWSNFDYDYDDNQYKSELKGWDNNNENWDSSNDPVNIDQELYHIIKIVPKSDHFANLELNLCPESYGVMYISTVYGDTCPFSQDYQDEASYDTMVDGNDYYDRSYCNTHVGNGIVGYTTWIKYKKNWGNPGYNPAIESPSVYAPSN